MTGWAIFAALALAALGILWRFGEIARPAWTPVAAALTIATIGYAAQRDGGRIAVPTVAPRPDLALNPALIDLRGAMTERFGSTGNWLIFSDGLLRAGESRAAVLALRSGINENPRSAALWTALGSALIAHDGGAILPPARFAFARAVTLDPASPAPWFFLGLAELRAGNADVAERMWTRAYRLAPPNADYRRQIGIRLAELRRRIAARG